MRLVAGGVSIALGAAGAGVSPGAADPVAGFYRDRTITFMIGSDPGGAFDAYARLLSEAMPRYLPGAPKIIVKYTGGQSGGLQLAEMMQNVAPRDGSIMAMTTQSVVVHQMLRPDFARYDARQWSWLGNMAPQRSVLSVWHTARARTIDEARRGEAIMGATAQTSPTYFIPDLMNKFIGTKYRIVTGYKNVVDLNLAMQRGEIEGRASSWLSIIYNMADDYAAGRVKPLVVSAISRQPEIADVPTLAELMSDPAHRRVAEFISAESDYGRSVFLPPGVPVERIEALRAAFAAALRDPALLAEARKINAPIEYMSAGALEELTRKVTSTPREALDYAR